MKLLIKWSLTAIFILRIRVNFQWKYDSTLMSRDLSTRVGKARNALTHLVLAGSVWNCWKPLHGVWDASLFNLVDIRLIPVQSAAISWHCEHEMKAVGFEP